MTLNCLVTRELRRSLGEAPSVSNRAGEAIYITLSLSTDLRPDVGHNLSFFKSSVECVDAALVGKPAPILSALKPSEVCSG